MELESLGSDKNTIKIYERTGKQYEFGQCIVVQLSRQKSKHFIMN